MSTKRAQERANANKGVSASNNPFKQNDAKAKPAGGSMKGLPKAGQVGGKVGGQAPDQASSNIEKLLKWIQKRINQYEAVDVKNFTSSWEDGKALCALMNYLLGDEQLNPEDVKPDDRIHNLTLAIKVATENGVPELIKAEEVGLDRRSMITYLHMVYTKLFVEKKDKEEKKEE
jgi:hypothetical protein